MPKRDRASAPKTSPAGVHGGASALDEREEQMQADYEWGLHDDDVRRAYAGQVVAVHRRKVWGSGYDHLAAWHAARKNSGCPARERIAFVVVPPHGQDQ